MKFSLAAAASALCLAATSVSATDFGTAQWAGAYLGATLGFGSATYDLGGTYSNPSLPLSASLNLPDLGAQGALGGIQFGYNFVNQSQFLFGVQLDGTWSGINNDTALSVASGASSLSANYDLNADSLYTLAARVGYFTSENTMVYGLLGASRANFSGSYSASVNGVPVLSDGYDFSLNGLAFGVGMETALSQNVTFGLEYRYHSMDRYSFYDGALLGGDRLEIGADTSIHTLRASLNYHF